MQCAVTKREEDIRISRPTTKAELLDHSWVPGIIGRKTTGYVTLTLKGKAEIV